VSDSVPQPFLDIARHALRREPRRRWTIPEIAARLNPVAAAAAAAQAVSPLAVPLSSVPARPCGKAASPKVRRTFDKSAGATPRSQAAKPAEQTLVLPAMSFLLPLCFW